MERWEEAKRWARQAGQILLDYYGEVGAVRAKGEVDFVTEADRASEQFLLSAIGEAFPDDGILTEESAGKESQSEYLWVLDPLDGTTNFLHTHPYFAVSIGVYRGGKSLAAAVYLPCFEELFWARRGGGAFLGEQPIAVSSVESLQGALLATGFPYDRRQNVEELLARLRRAMLQGHGIRRAGAAAVDLCYVACGRIDVFWEERLQAWDIAAGRLLVEEAGGQVSDFAGNPWRFESPAVMATNGRLHLPALELLGDSPSGDKNRRKRE